MTGNRIIDEITVTESNIDKFMGVFADDAASKSSYSRWNAKDVVSHINEWIRHSKEKLYCIKTNAPISEIADYHEYNRLMYMKNKDKTPAEAIEEVHRSISEYKKIAALYGNDDLARKDYPTGFQFELWRYMIMDGSIHPNLHLMFHYLTEKRYEDFIGLLKATKETFLEYSKDDLNVYDFGDFIDGNGEFAENLPELEKIRLGDPFIQEIIQLNNGKNSR